MCEDCPLERYQDDCDGDCEKCNSEENKIKRATEYCTRCEILIGDECYLTCINKSNHYEDSYFRIEEIEVIE